MAVAVPLVSLMTKVAGHHRALLEAIAAR